MPIFDYTCSTCGAIEEVVYLHGEEIISTRPCYRCGAEADKRDVNRFRIVGPVWSDLDRFNTQLLPSDERRAGAEFKTGKDIDRWEQEHNLRRVDHGSVEQRTMLEDQRDEAATIRRVKEQDGTEAAFDHVTKQSVLSKTSWSSADYDRYKGTSDAVDSNPK